MLVSVLASWHLSSLDGDVDCEYDGDDDDDDDDASYSCPSCFLSCVFSALFWAWRPSLCRHPLTHQLNFQHHRCELK